MLGATEDIVEQFSTSELVVIAEYLGLAPISKWGPRKLVDVIRLHLRQQGLPSLDKEHSELVEDFLYVDGWIGEQITNHTSTLGEYLASLGKSMDDLPECWSFADDADPACKKCGVYAWCAEHRIQNLPPCFAKLYDAGEEECMACLEAPFCSGNTDE